MKIKIIGYIAGAALIIAPAYSHITALYKYGLEYYEVASFLYLLSSLSLAVFIILLSTKLKI
tara:strand:- start:225 stop:410 length:186 start_codon:yes stop_codon:yes gene_type:complete